MDTKNKTVQVSTGGVSFTTLLGLVFIGLKLTGVLGWSWIWVLCPFWIGLATVVALVLGFFLFLFVGIFVGAALKR